MNSVNLEEHEYVQGEPVAAQSPGEILRERRELRALSVQQVADELHLTMHFIRALEADEYDKLPGDVFARGYLRSYASLLKLNPEKLSQSFNDYVHAKETRLRATRERRTAKRRKDKNRPWIIFSGIAFVGVAAALWYFNAGIDAIVPDLSNDSVIDTPASGQRAPRQSPVGTALPASVDQASAGAGQDPAPPVTAPDQVETLGTPESTQDPAQRLISVAASGDDLLRVELTGESWVAVDDGSDAPVFRDMLVSGDVLEVRGTAPFSVLLGDSSVTQLFFNGKQVDMAANVRADNSARLNLGL